MGTYLGIDFGTSFCRAGVLKDGTFEVIKLKYSIQELPMFIGVTVNRGRHGNRRLNFDGIKQKTDFEVNVSYRNENVPLINITSAIFNDIKNDVNNIIDYQIDSTILTVPSCFTERQRASLKSAAEQAGFRNLNLLDESTALLLSTELPKNWNNILVLTLGAGVFNLSFFNNTKGSLKAIWHGGNRHLGGNNFDNVIISYLIEKQILNESIFHSGSRYVYEVKKAAQFIKHSLSEKTENDFDFTKDLPSSLLSGKFNMTRSEFEKIIQNEVDEITNYIDKGITECGIDPSSIDLVILEGGSTQIPLLKENIISKFGPNVVFASNIQIAKGATLYGNKFPNKLKVGQSAEDGKKDLAPKATEDKTQFAQPESVKKEEGWISLFSNYITEAQDLWKNYKQTESIEKLETLRSEVKKFINSLYLQHGRNLLIENKVDEAYQILLEGIKFNNSNEAIVRMFTEACIKKSGLEAERGNFDGAKNVILQGMKFLHDSKPLRTALKEIKNLKVRSHNTAYSKSKK